MMDPFKTLNIPLPPGEGNQSNGKSTVQKEKERIVDEYDDSLSEGEIRSDSEDDGGDAKKSMPLDVDTNAVDMVMSDDGEIDEQDQDISQKVDQSEHSNYQQWDQSQYSYNYTDQSQYSYKNTNQAQYSYKNRDQSQYYSDKNRDQSQYSDKNRDQSQYSNKNRDQSQYSDKNRDQSQYSNKNRDQSQYSDKNRDQSQYSDKNADQSQYSDKNTDQFEYSDKNTDKNTDQSQYSYEYDNTSAADWYPDQNTTMPSVIEKQTNVAFENQYDPEGPPIDYYIPWIMRQTKYDTQPYYRPLPILDDAFYMYDWDFGEPFHEIDDTGPHIVNKGITSIIQSQKERKDSSERKKSNESGSSDEEEVTSHVRRAPIDLTPPRPIETLSHEGNKLQVMQCVFCGRIFLELMAFDNHIKYVHGEKSRRYEKRVWQPSAHRAGQSWKCQLCRTFEGTALGFMMHLRTENHMSNLLRHGEWEIDGYQSGEFVQPEPSMVNVMKETRSNHFCLWFLQCLLCKRSLEAQEYCGQLVPTGNTLTFKNWKGFVKHLASHHYETSPFTSEILKLLLYLLQMTNEISAPVPQMFNMNQGAAIFNTFNTDQAAANQYNMNAGATSMTQYGGTVQYPGWNNVISTTVLVAYPTTTTSLVASANTSSGAANYAAAQLPGSNLSNQVPVKLPSQPVELEPAATQPAEDTVPESLDEAIKTDETPPRKERGKRRRHRSESSDDSYDSDEARLGSRIHHAARKRESRPGSIESKPGNRELSKEQDEPRRRSSSYYDDAWADLRSSYDGPPRWPHHFYDERSRWSHFSHDGPRREWSSYHEALSKYRDKRLYSSSDRQGKRRHGELSHGRERTPETYVDRKGKKVIDYHNSRCSTSFLDVKPEPEPEPVEPVNVEPPGPKLPDFNDLATILQTVNHHTARKQEIRAQGMTDLLKTLYNKEGTPDTAQESTSAPDPTSKLSVFDQMQSTIHKILREEKKPDQEKTGVEKGGSIRLAIVKIVVKLYKDDFAEGTELCTSLVERVVKDFVAVKSASSTSSSGPAGPDKLDPRKRASEEEKAQLTVLIRRHAEELLLIKQAKQLVQTVEESSEEEDDDEDDEGHEEDPLAAQKKLLLIAYGVILDSLAPGAIKTEHDNQMAADIILQLTHHMFNLMNTGSNQGGNTISLQEKYMMVGQLKSRYGTDHPLISALDCAVCISLDIIRELCKLSVESLNKLPAILWQQPGLAYNTFQDINQLQEVLGAYFALG